MRLLFTVLCFVTVVGACRKPSQAALTTESANPADVGAEKPEEAPSADLQLHLFDDDERIIVTSASIDAELEKAEFETDEATAEELKILAYSAYIDAIVAEAFAAEGATLGLGLVPIKMAVIKNTAEIQAVAAQKSLVSATKNRQFLKGAIRVWESFQDFMRRLTKGKDYKETYFNKAIGKKRNQGGAFDQMKAIETKIEIKDVNLLSKGNRVYLGMLPDTAILNQLRKEAGTEKLNVVSVIEDFELKRAQEDMAALKRTSSDWVNFQEFSKGRYRLELNTKTLEVTSWTQYATPDRTMLTSSVLRSAIDDVAQAIKDDKFVYVHCKSGKGRSASVVVGARSAVVIDAAKADARQLSKSEINQILDEQIAQVKSSRDAIGISFAQKTNLQRVLYEKANLAKG